jgi:hypothetical protein
VKEHKFTVPALQPLALDIQLMCQAFSENRDLVVDPLAQLRDLPRRATLTQVASRRYKRFTSLRCTIGERARQVLPQ